MNLRAPSKDRAFRAVGFEGFAVREGKGLFLPSAPARSAGGRRSLARRARLLAWSARSRKESNLGCGVLPSGELEAKQKKGPQALRYFAVNFRAEKPKLLDDDLRNLAELAVRSGEAVGLGATLDADSIALAGESRGGDRLAVQVEND